MSLDTVTAALGRGDCLVAHDLAMRSLESDPTDLRAAYLAVLALARSGATHRALEQFSTFGLDAVDLSTLPGELAEDIGALEARLAKDAALAAAGTDRAHLAAVAADRYEATYRSLGRPFACVNAATMWRLAGDAARSRTLSLEALRLVTSKQSVPDYWARATEAESLLLLGDDEAARRALAGAVALDHDVAALASTRRQLSLVCDIADLDPGLLDILQVPRVIHYTGHMVARPGEGGRMDPREEPRVAREVTALLERIDVGAGYGALASGADILVAEALLARGAELHVVLPFEVAAFVQASVEPAGARWRVRFDTCLARAASVTVVADRGDQDSPVLFEHGARVAMGMAVLRASYLGTEAEQVAVWNGQAPTTAGTGADMTTWARAGRSTHVLPAVADADPPPPADTPAKENQTRRSVRALLFADVRGFSKLGEEQIEPFIDTVLTPMAEVIERFDDGICFRNTWGDGLYLVFESVAQAAVCALDLQRAVGGTDFTAAGLPENLALRIGAHAGPVFERVDPITGRPGYYGVEVTRTARIEPGTPVGDVYVTGAFAALVALGDVDTFSCQYVGPVPTAKGFGVLPLYALRRR